MKSLHIILAIVLLIGSATALTAQTAPPETGKVVVENDEFKPEIEIKMTRTALDSGTSFTLEIKKDKKPMDEFTRAMIADTAPVIVQFYFAGRDTPVSVGEAGAVNFIADGKQVTGGELRRVDYTFSSFKTKKIDDPIQSKLSSSLPRRGQ